MAYSLVELLNSHMPSVVRTVDLTLSTLSSTGARIIPGMPDPALDMFFPMQSYLSSKVALLKMRDSRPTLGYLVGIDGEIPTDRSPIDLTQEVIGRLKIGKAQEFLESDLEYLRDVQMMMATMPEAAQQILDHYLQTPVLMTMGLVGLMRLMAIRVACTGVAIYTDPNSGLNTNSLSYAAQIPSGNLAATKTGTARWSQIATSNPIQDIVDHAEDVFDNIKSWPPYIVMGRKAATNLRLAASTKETIARVKGIITDSSTVDAASIASIEPPTLSEVSATIARRLTGDDGASPDTMQIIVSEATWRSRNNAGVVQTGNYIPDDYYFFAWPGMIEEAMTPIASNNFAGGISVKADRLLPSEPPREIVTVATGFIPLCPDPRLIAARNVEDTVLAA